MTREWTHRLRPRTRLNFLKSGWMVLCLFGLVSCVSVTGTEPPERHPDFTLVTINGSGLPATIISDASGTTQLAKEELWLTRDGHYTMRTKLIILGAGATKEETQEATGTYRRTESSYVLTPEDGAERVLETTPRGRLLGPNRFGNVAEYLQVFETQ